MARWRSLTGLTAQTGSSGGAPCDRRQREHTICQIRIGPAFKPQPVGELSEDFVAQARDIGVKPRLTNGPREYGRGCELLNPAAVRADRHSTDRPVLGPDA